MQAARVIVVGLDYSPLSEAALHRALRMTEVLPYATLHAVTVGTRVDEGVRLPDGSQMSRWAALDAVRMHLRERMRTLPEVGARNLRVVGHVRSGDPAQAILDLTFTCNAERIVLGAHSEAGTGRLEVGGVVREVLSRASVDVHVETPLAAAPSPPPPFDPLRWAHVFGGGRRRPSEALGVPQVDAIMKA